MRVIIAGSRDISDLQLVRAAIEASGFLSHITEVVSGKARGVDQAGEQWASAQRIPIQGFCAEWQRYGRAAGPRRNEQMARYADALIAIPSSLEPETRSGTWDMIRRARARGLPVYVHGIGLLS